MDKTINWINSVSLIDLMLLKSFSGMTRNLPD